jgi:hypothetical protein
MYRLLLVLLANCAGGILHAQQVPGWHAQKRFELRNRGHLAVAESTLRERLRTADKAHHGLAIALLQGDSLQPVALASSREYLYPGWQPLVVLDSLVGLAVDGVPLPVTAGLPVSVYVGNSVSSIHFEFTTPDGTADLVLRVLPPCDLPLPDLPPWPVADPEQPWWVGTYAGSEAVEGWALPRLGSDQVFDRPVVVVEGFDPGLSSHIPMVGAGDMHWEVLWHCTESTYPDTEHFPELLDSLYAVGMDLVYVDFSDGTRSVAAQSALVQHVLSLCNAAKSGNEPLVVVGASMGGLIARHALRSLELAGTPSCTRLFIALDSPFRGAYIPVGMQQAIGALAAISAPAHAMHEALNSPAARELLAARPGPGLSDFEALQAELHAAGLPKLPVCLAVSDGRPDGPPLLDTGPLLSASAGVWGWDWAHVDVHALPGNPQHPASSPTSYVTCDLSLPQPAPLESGSLWYSYVGHAPATSPVWEALPGSTSGHLSSFAEALADAGLEVNALQEEALFIPARSALDMPLWEANGDTPFDAISLQPSFRPAAPHCDIEDHVSTLLDHIIGGALYLDTPTETSAVLTYGADTPYAHWVPGVNLSAPGGIRVYTEVELEPCADTVRLGDGTSLALGWPTPEAPGTLHVRAGQTLILEPGSQLDLGPLSSLELHAGATLIVATSEALLHSSARLVVHPGGTLRVEAPGSIELLDEDARIHLNTSRLETTGEATISGSGALEVTGFSTVSIENGHLALRGIDSAASLLRLAPESGLGVFGPGTWSVAQAQLRLGTDSQLALHTSTELDTVQLAAPEWTAFLRSHARLRLQAVHSRGIATYHEHPSGASFRASQSSWETAPLELAASGFRFSSCTFMSSPVVATGSGFPSRVENSAFGGPTPAVEALFRISDCSGPTTFEACTFQDAVLGLDASHAELRIRCSTFAGLDTALSAGIGGMIDLGAQAHNQFTDNRNHIAFADAPVPDLAHGENAFGMWSESLFAGTWDVACMAGCQLIAPGNAWPWSSPGTPYLLGLQGMHCTGCPAGIAQLSDPAPVLPRTCTADGDRPITEAGDTRPRSSEDEAATGLRIVPNPSRGLARLIPPSEWGTSIWRFTVSDSQGARVAHSDTHSGTVEWNSTSLAPGIYFVRAETLDVPRLFSQQSILILSP